MGTEMVLGRWIPWSSRVRDADWESLYAEQLPRVYNFFRYRVGHGAVAEDLTSLTFEKAWQARDRYRRDLASFSTWLMAIARNVAVDHYRSRALRTAAPLEEAEGLAGPPSPETLAVARSDAEHLAKRLATLPDRERELIALKYGAGLTNRGIARLLSMTESNVGTILHRTIQRLRADWEEEGGSS
jgi:RNA polymerase sigma-70 factor (ECF subfamily)